MFNSTRWKLTGWYVLIISIISLTFSGVIYKMVSIEIDRLAFEQRVRWEKRLLFKGLRPMDFEPIPFAPWGDPDLAKDSKKRLFTILGMVNGFILVLSGGLAYLLSGITLRPIKEMMEEQSRFIADASHELKTPLTALKTSMEVFLKDPRSQQKEAKLLIGDSLLEVNRLQLLSEGLLGLTKSKKLAKKEGVDMDEVIKKVADKYALALKNKNISLKIKTGHYKVLGIFQDLELLLGNLIDNAIKFSLSGGKIGVELTKTNGQIRLTVKDSGIGISKNDLPYIFERFYRADSARSWKETPGHGLGLAIVKRIADDMGAMVEVKSQIGRGSTFTVVFQK